MSIGRPSPIIDGSKAIREATGVARDLTQSATCSTSRVVRTAGIREARQQLSALLAEVRKGREVIITDRGEPVACLVPPPTQSRRPFSSRRRFRDTVHLKGKPLSHTVAEDRGDRW